MASLHETFYQANIFSGMTMNQRAWFAPDLMAAYQKSSIWRPLVPSQVKLTDTATMTFSMLGNFEPNHNPIGWNDLYVNPMYADSRQITISTARYGGKIQMWKQDDFLNYWREGNVGSMAAIIRTRFGPAVAKVLDTLARNAFLQSHYPSYAMDTSNTGFNHIVVGDTFDLDWLDYIQLRMATMELPGFDGKTPGSIVCICSPGTLYSIRQHQNWTDWNKNTAEGRNALIDGIVGSINGVSFVPHNSAILWNAGTITQQSNITAPVRAGSGAASSVYGWNVGQTGATHYVTLNSVASLAVGDIVTVHQTRTSTYGVTNGVDPYDGMTFQRQIYSIDAGNKRVSFTEPLLWPFDTDLGGSVYGYVTKAVNIHASTFIAGPGAVVLGVTEPIQMHEPKPDDDFESVYRLTWDGFFKFQPFRDEWVLPLFHAGYHSVDGSLQTGA